MSLVKEESVDKTVGIISMQDFLHFLKVNLLFLFLKIELQNCSFSVAILFSDKLAC